MILLNIIFTSIILYWAACYLKISNSKEFKKSFFTAFQTMLTYGAFAYFLSIFEPVLAFLSLFFLIHIIKYFYKLDIKKASKLALYYLLFLLPIVVVFALIISIPDIIEIMN